MTSHLDLQTLYTEMEAGIPLAKCQKCGCMRETLDTLLVLTPTLEADEAHGLAQHAADWAKHMQPTQYACLGCEHCYAGAAQNAFASAFPAAANIAPLSCDFQIGPSMWPPVVGEYFVVDPSAPVAVSTLASIELAGDLARLKPAGLAIVGKTETENIGLDKVIKNIITNTAIHFLIVTGQESSGHNTGQTLIALANHGVDANGRIVGTSGKRPILRNVSLAEIEMFRQQVQVIDLIGCENQDVITARIVELSQSAPSVCSCGTCAEQSAPIAIPASPTVMATEPDEAIPLDRAGYFVVMPLADKALIHVEYYGYDNTLLQVIEGATPRALYTTIIANGWVTELSHAAYLGKELAKADLSLKHGLKYVQDGA